jgi:hypothetical protein
MLDEKQIEQTIEDNGKFFQRVNGKLKVNKHNWKSLVKTSWKDLFLMIGIICACLLYFQGTQDCRMIAENPCNYCLNSITNTPYYIIDNNNSNLTFTILEDSVSDRNFTK